MIITIDEGTTSTRALMISQSGEILGTVQKEINQIYPNPRWVEQDPLEIWNKTLACARELVQNLITNQNFNKEDIQGIAITNQRETTIVWDPKTGKPVYNAIVWQCKRTADLCKELRETSINPQINWSEYIRAKTGLIIDSYFSATKIHWILNHVPDLNPEELCFGTIDSWLIWNLTLGREHLTDYSNASRTMLWDIHEDKWDSLILDKLKIPTSLLPRVIESNGDFGSSPLFKDLLGRELPIKAVLGDQQAALYAYKNEAKITYGTGVFILNPSTHVKYQNAAEQTLNNEIQSSLSKIKNEDREKISINSQIKNPKLLESIGFKTNQDKLLVLEASIFSGGSIIQWLRDELEIIQSSSEIEALASLVEDNGGVYLIPAFSGLGAPFWQEDIQAALFGLRRSSNKSHIARASLEAIAYQVKAALDVMDSNLKPSSLNVDGGASKNDLLMQFQADLLQIPIKRYTETEMTALGVALMTGDVELKLSVDKVFEPKNNYENEYQTWVSLLGKLLIA